MGFFFSLKALEKLLKAFFDEHLTPDTFYECDALTHQQ